MDAVPTYPQLQHLFWLVEISEKGERYDRSENWIKNASQILRKMVAVTDNIFDNIIDSEKDSNDMCKGIDRNGT